MGRITKIAGKRYTVNARNSITYHAKGDVGIAINSASNTNYSTGGNYVLADYGEQEKEEEESGNIFHLPTGATTKKGSTKFREMTTTVLGPPWKKQSIFS